MDNPWYAVQCKARQDARAECELGRQGYEVFRPKVQARRAGRCRIDSFFPRYLFIRLGTGLRSFAPVRSTRGVLRLISWGSVAPRVPDVVIEELQRSCDESGCVRVAENRFRPGQRVRITDGPFHDLTCRLVSCSADERVVVLLDLLQRPQQVTLPAELVEAC